MTDYCNFFCSRSFEKHAQSFDTEERTTIIFFQKILVIIDPGMIHEKSPLPAKSFLGGEQVAPD